MTAGRWAATHRRMSDSSQRPVRVRIAPSPTGEPHVGTAYVGLFNLTVARQNGGKFILRIEDTDQERSKPQWETQIIDGLSWLGIDWDEGPDKGGPYGPYRQSERRPIYLEHANVLINGGHAYRCFCTKARLDEVRAKQREAGGRFGYDRHCRDLAADEVAKKLQDSAPFTVRMKMPLDGQTVVQDVLRGEVTFDNAQVDDQILLKSDGFPTYHLACVVDDHLMEITHVIRAEEWITSTPKHVVLYDMFGWQAPKFHHLPLLRNADKSKISKRKNPVSILDYKARGFLPEAVINYLAMLGWTMPDGTELFGLEDFVREFTWDRLNLGGPVFDLEKLTWLNGKYYRERLSDDALAEVIRRDVLSDERLRQIVPLIRERIDVAEDFIAATSYFFTGDVEVEAEALKPKKRTYKELRLILEKYGEAIDQQLDFSPPAIEAMSRAFAETHEWHVRDLFMPLRVGITGRKATPPLFDTMSVLGRPRVRRRLRAVILLLKKAAQQDAKKK